MDNRINLNNDCVDNTLTILSKHAIFKFSRSIFTNQPNERTQISDHVMMMKSIFINQSNEPIQTSDHVMMVSSIFINRSTLRTMTSFLIIESL